MVRTSEKISKQSINRWRRNVYRPREKTSLARRVSNENDMTSWERHKELSLSLVTRECMRLRGTLYTCISMTLYVVLSNEIIIISLVLTRAPCILEIPFLKTVFCSDGSTIPLCFAADSLRRRRVGQSLIRGTRIKNINVPIDWISHYNTDLKCKQ